MELEVRLQQPGALAGLVVFHVHVVRAPVPVQVLVVIIENQGLEQHILAVVELDLSLLVVFLVQPDDLAGIA